MKKIRKISTILFSIFLVISASVGISLVVCGNVTGGGSSLTETVDEEENGENAENSGESDKNVDNSGELSTSDGNSENGSKSSETSSDDEVKGAASDYWYSYTEEFDDSTTTIKISTAGQLAYLAYMVNSGNNTYAGYVFQLTANIDLSEHYWVPIGGHEYDFSATNSSNFAGEFDGNGYTISGIKTYYDENAEDLTVYDYAGLFGSVRGKATSSYCEIHDVCVAGSTICGYQYVGAVVGYAYLYSEVHNCYLTDDSQIYSSYYSLGGIVGESLGNGGYYPNEIYDCFVDETCLVDGITFGDCTDVGGIVGTAYRGNVIEKCFNLGSVNGCGFVGGIVGDANSVKSSSYAIYIRNCYNRGSVTCTEAYCAGILGVPYYPTHVYVYNCYNTGTIEGPCFVGGIVTDSASVIYNCFNTGNVTATSETNYVYVGGIIGGYVNGIVCHYCYYSGIITGYQKTYQKGIAGTADASTTAIYEENLTTYAKDAGWFGGTGSVSSATWSEDYPWDFDTVWMIDSNFNDGYPILTALVKTLTINYTGAYANTTNLAISVTSGTGTVSETPISSGSSATVITYPILETLTISLSSSNSSYNYYISIDSTPTVSSTLNSTTYSWDSSEDVTIDVYLYERMALTVNYTGSYLNSTNLSATISSGTGTGGSSSVASGSSTTIYTYYNSGTITVALSRVNSSYTYYISVGSVPTVNSTTNSTTYSWTSTANASITVYLYQRMSLTVSYKGSYANSTNLSATVSSGSASGGSSSVASDSSTTIYSYYNSGTITVALSRVNSSYTYYISVGSTPTTSSSENSTTTTWDAKTNSSITVYLYQKMTLTISFTASYANAPTVTLSAGTGSFSSTSISSATSATRYLYAVYSTSEITVTYTVTGGYSYFYTTSNSTPTRSSSSVSSGGAVTTKWTPTSSTTTYLNLYQRMSLTVQSYYATANNTYTGPSTTGGSVSLVFSNSTINTSISNSTEYFVYNSSVTLTPTANSGYTFKGWTSTTYTSSPSYVSTSSPYTFTLSSASYTRVAVFGPELSYDSDGNYWYFEDGEYPQTYYGTSAPSGISSTASYTLKVNGTSVPVYSSSSGTKYAKITLNGTTAYFVVEPIRWLCLTGSTYSTSWKSADTYVSVNVIVAGAVTSDTTSSGWNWTDSTLYSEVSTLQSCISLSSATSTSRKYDAFTTPGQIVVKQDSVAASNVLSVASVDEIDDIGGSYRAEATDFVAFVTSNGATTSGGKDAAYWTRDLAYELGSGSTYGTSYYTGCYNQGVYVTSDGILSNATLKNVFGARLSVAI